MIVLSEDSPRLPPSASAHALKSATEAARIVGCDIRYIPQEAVCPSATDALSYVPVQREETPGLWIGYIPSVEWYSAIYNECLQKRIRLLNSPDEHLNAQEFDRAYPYLKELTPESLILVDASQCEQAIAELGLPIFVKGTIQSRKASGRKACVAETPEELKDLCNQLLSLDSRSRGRVIARRFVPLRHRRISGEGFPLGREYRVFLYRQICWAGATTGRATIH